jgi:hypothetical protein
MIVQLSRCDSIDIEAESQIVILKFIRNITRHNDTSNSINEVVDSAKNEVLTNWSSVEDE